MKYVFIVIGFVLLLVGCETKKLSEEHEQKEGIETTEADKNKKLGSKEKGVSKDKSQVKTIKSREIIHTDTSYSIQFYNKEGQAVGEYDIWGNNPLDLDFEKYDETPGEHPMRYKVPKLTKDQLNGSVPDELIRNLDSGVHIGRIDVHTRVSKKGEDFIGLLYHVEAKEGFEEEYTIPSTMGIIKVFDEKGKVIAHIRFPNSGGWEPVVTQDGKFLTYHTFSEEKNKWGCLNVYDLKLEQEIHKTCTDSGLILNGAVLINGHLIAALAVDRIGEKSIMHYIDSQEEVLYKKALPINRSNYYPNYLNNGVVLIDRKSKTADTLLYDRDFEIINLK